jgi:hypothetical protein
MKRLLFSAFGLLATFPAWGEDLPAEIPDLPDPVAVQQLSAPVVSAALHASDGAVTAESVKVSDHAPVGQFRERPIRTWPVYYHREFTPEHERTIYGPLWLTEQDGDSTLNYPLWPFTGVTRFEGNVKKLDLVWPFTTYERTNGHTNFDLVWPFTGFTHDDTPEREKYSLFLAWPLVGYYHGTDRAPGDGTVTGEQTGYIPLYFSSKKENGTFRYIFPSFFSDSNKENRTNVHTFLPLYFYSDNPEGSALFLLPTYLHIKNSRRQLYSFLPFFHSDHNETDDLRFIFPSYFRSESGSDGTLTGLLPFYLAKNTTAGTSYRYVFPTWFEQHREKYDSTWFLPFYSLIEDATQGGLVSHQTVLWPLYYHRNDEGKGNATTSVLLNLYFKKTSVSESERYTSILWPIISVGESPDYRLVRIWPYAYLYQAEDNFRSHYFLWPLVGFGSGDRESMASVLPLYYHRSDPERSFTLLLPFYLRIQTPESRISLIFPLMYQRASGEDTENLLLNTWWSRTGERNTFAFFPLYYRSTAPGMSQTQVVNTWWERGDQRSSFIFFPLYFHYDTPAESGSLLLNTWWSGGERLETFVFFPLAWYFSPSPDEHDFTFFPVFSYDHKGEESSTFSLLWRVYYQRHDRDGSMSAFLWWLYRTEERHDFRRLMCWPFVDYEHNTGATDEVFTSVLLHLLTYERNGARIRFKLFGLTLYES